MMGVWALNPVIDYHEHVFGCVLGGTGEHCDRFLLTDVD